MSVFLLSVLGSLFIFLPHLDSNVSSSLRFCHRYGEHVAVCCCYPTSRQSLLSQRSCHCSYQDGQWSPGSKESLSVLVMPAALGRVDSSCSDMHFSDSMAPPPTPPVSVFRDFSIMPLLKVQEFLKIILGPLFLLWLLFQ